LLSFELGSWRLADANVKMNRNRFDWTAAETLGRLTFSTFRLIWAREYSSNQNPGSFPRELDSLMVAPTLTSHKLNP
jgi:hypothetical protein